MSSSTGISTPSITEPASPDSAVCIVPVVPVVLVVPVVRVLSTLFWLFLCFGVVGDGGVLSLPLSFTSRMPFEAVIPSGIASRSTSEVETLVRSESPPPKACSISLPEDSKEIPLSAMAGINSAT